MRVAIGSDKSGFTLKEAIKSFLASEEGKALGVDFDPVRDDLGTKDISDVHPYYRVAGDVAPRVLSGEYDRAILICGTGAGMNVVANKFKGLSAVVCEGVYSARMARVINGAQVLCMGGWIIAPEMGVEMAKAFLSAETYVGIEEWRKEWLAAAAQKVEDIEERNFAH